MSAAPWDVSGGQNTGSGQVQLFDPTQFGQGNDAQQAPVGASHGNQEGQPPNEGYGDVHAVNGQGNQNQNWNQQWAPPQGDAQNMWYGHNAQGQGYDQYQYHQPGQDQGFASQNDQAGNVQSGMKDWNWDHQNETWSNQGQNYQYNQQWEPQAQVNSVQQESYESSEQGRVVTSEGGGMATGSSDFLENSLGGQSEGSALSSSSHDMGMGAFFHPGEEKYPESQTGENIPQHAAQPQNASSTMQDIPLDDQPELAAVPSDSQKMFASSSFSNLEHEPSPFDEIGAGGSQPPPPPTNYSNPPVPANNLGLPPPIHSRDSSFDSNVQFILGGSEPPSHNQSAAQSASGSPDLFAPTRQAQPGNVPQDPDSQIPPAYPPHTGAHAQNLTTSPNPQANVLPAASLSASASIDQPVPVSENALTPEDAYPSEITNNPAQNTIPNDALPSANMASSTVNQHAPPVEEPSLQPVEEAVSESLQQADDAIQSEHQMNIYASAIGTSPTSPFQPVQRNEPPMNSMPSSIENQEMTQPAQANDRERAPSVSSSMSSHHGELVHHNPMSPMAPGLRPDGQNIASYPRSGFGSPHNPPFRQDNGSSGVNPAPAVQAEGEPTLQIDHYNDQDIPVVSRNLSFGSPQQPVNVPNPHPPPGPRQPQEADASLPKVSAPSFFSPGPTPPAAQNNQPFQPTSSGASIGSAEALPPTQGNFSPYNPVGPVSSGVQPSGASANLAKGETPTLDVSSNQPVISEQQSLPHAMNMNSPGSQNHPHTMQNSGPVTTPGMSIGTGPAGPKQQLPGPPQQGTPPVQPSMPSPQAAVQNTGMPSPSNNTRDSANPAHNPSTAPPPAIQYSSPPQATPSNSQTSSNSNSTLEILPSQPVPEPQPEKSASNPSSRGHSEDSIAQEIIDSRREPPNPRADDYNRQDSYDRGNDDDRRPRDDRDPRDRRDKGYDPRDRDPRNRGPQDYRDPRDSRDRDPRDHRDRYDRDRDYDRYDRDRYDRDRYDPREYDRNYDRRDPYYRDDRRYRPQSRGHYDQSGYPDDPYGRPRSRQGYPEERPRSRQGHGSYDYDRQYFGDYHGYGDRSRPGYPDERYDRPRSRQGYPDDRPPSRPSSIGPFERPSSRGPPERPTSRGLPERPTSRGPPERPHSRQGHTGYRDRDQRQREMYNKRMSNEVYYTDQYGREYTYADYYRQQQQQYLAGSDPYGYPAPGYDRYSQGYLEEMNYYAQQTPNSAYPQPPLGYPSGGQYDYDKQSQHSSQHSRGNTPGPYGSGADAFAQEYSSGSRPSSRASGYGMDQSPIYPPNDTTRHGYHEQSYDPSYSYSEPYVPPEPQRMTPPKFSLPHCRASFGPGGQLIKVLPNHPADGQPATVVVEELEVIASSAGKETLQTYPGPLTRVDSHKNDVLLFCQKSARECMESSSIVDRDSAVLIWKFLELLIKQNGTIVGTDIADLLLDGHDLSSTYQKMSPTMSSDSPALVESSGDNLSTSVVQDRSSINKTSQAMDGIIARFRELLLHGRKKDALEWAMKQSLWGHALFLASKMDPKTHASIMTRFANSSMRMNDPLQTLFQLMSGRQPAAVTLVVDEKWGDWRPHLAMILSNQTSRPDLDKKSIITLGDTLASKGCLHASHFCYLMAQVTFGTYNKKSSKVVLIGSNHALDFGVFATNTAIQCTEVYEYAQSLGNPTYILPSLQLYKLLYAVRLAEAGLSEEALRYIEVISNTVLANPGLYPAVLVKQLYELGNRLKHYDPLRLQSGEEFTDPQWLNQLFATAKALEDGSIQPIAGDQTPYGFTSTRASSEVGEIMAGHSQMDGSMLQQGYNTSQSYGYQQPWDPNQSQQTWDQSQQQQQQTQLTWDASQQATWDQSQQQQQLQQWQGNQQWNDPALQQQQQQQAEFDGSYLGYSQHQQQQPQQHGTDGAQAQEAGTQPEGGLLKVPGTDQPDGGNVNLAGSMNSQYTSQTGTTETEDEESSQLGPLPPDARPDNKENQGTTEGPGPALEEYDMSNLSSDLLDISLSLKKATTPPPTEKKKKKKRKARRGLSLKDADMETVKEIVNEQDLNEIAESPQTARSNISDLSDCSTLIQSNSYQSLTNEDGPKPSNNGHSRESSPKREKNVYSDDVIDYLSPIQSETDELVGAFDRSCEIETPSIEYKIDGSIVSDEENVCANTEICGMRSDIITPTENVLQVCPKKNLSLHYEAPASLLDTEELTFIKEKICISPRHGRSYSESYPRWSYVPVQNSSIDTKRWRRYSARRQSIGSHHSSSSQFQYNIYVSDQRRLSNSSRSPPRSPRKRTTSNNSNVSSPDRAKTSDELFKFGVPPPKSMMVSNGSSLPLGASATNFTNNAPPKKQAWPGMEDDDDKIAASAKKADPKKGNGPPGKPGESKGWFKGFFNKFKGNEIKLPDDKNPSIVWDEAKKKWVNTDGEEEDEKPAAPPPKDSDLMGGSPAVKQAVTPGGPPPPGATPGANRFSLQKTRGARNQYLDVFGGKKSNQAPANLFNVMPKSVSMPANIYNPSAVDEAKSQASDNTTEQGSGGVSAKPTLAAQAEEYQQQQPQAPQQQPPPLAQQFFNPNQFQQPNQQSNPGIPEDQNISRSSSQSSLLSREVQSYMQQPQQSEPTPAQAPGPPSNVEPSQSFPQFFNPAQFNQGGQSPVQAPRPGGGATGLRYGQRRAYPK